MKMRHKHLSALLIIITSLSFTLASCGGDENDEPSGDNNNAPTLNMVGSTIKGTLTWSDGAYTYADTYSLYFKTSSMAEGKLNQVVTEKRTGKRTGVYDSYYKYNYVIKSKDLIVLTEESGYQSTLSRTPSGWYWDWPKIALK